jgi:hypothetical protein
MARAKACISYMYMAIPVYSYYLDMCLLRYSKLEVHRLASVGFRCSPFLPHPRTKPTRNGS